MGVNAPCGGDRMRVPGGIGWLLFLWRVRGGGFAVEGSMRCLALMCFRHGVDVVMVV